MPHDITYDFEIDQTNRCRGKAQTDKATSEGDYFGKVYINGRYWAIIQWDDEDDPDLYKAEHVMLEQKNWISLEE